MIKEFTLSGGGLVGSLLALMLAKKGHKVQLIESRPDIRQHKISAGRSINLALANRGIWPLAKMGLMDEIESLLIPMKGRMIHDIDGKQTFQPYGQRSSDIIYSVSRKALNQLLLEKAEKTGLVKCIFNQQIKTIDFEQQLMTSNSNQTFNFQTLIGTDGANSAVRNALLQQQSTQNSIEPLSHSYKELTIPSKNGQFQLDKNALHIWPRGSFMLIALPNLDASFTVTLFMPNEGETSFESLNGSSALMTFFEQYFPSVIPLIPDLTTAFFNNPTGKLATVRCAPWHLDDKALVLGDAAHAIVPFHGQGMNCGFEDCDLFIELLEKHGVENITHVFEETEKARKPNADAIADMALENYVEMRDSVRQAEFVLKKSFAFKLQLYFPERFIPRYSMVMFEHLPYAEAKRLGEIHDKLLTELITRNNDASTLTERQADAILTKYGL